MSLRIKIKQAVKIVADAIENFVINVGDTIGGAMEMVGDANNDALNWFGKIIGAKPFFAWLGGIIKGVFSIIGVIIKGAFGIIAGIIGSFIKIFAGIITFEFSLILESLWDISSPMIGTIIIGIAKIISLIQSFFYAQDFERPLAEDEKAKLSIVYKNSLNYYVIRIIEGHSGLFGISSRPFTLGNTIYTKSSSFSIDVLIHESTHVWQYQQTGNRYASDAIAAQWFIKDGYNWEKEIKDRNKTNWQDFNKEAQAGFIEDLWVFGVLRDVAETIIQSQSGSFFTANNTSSFGYFEVHGKNYSTLANEAVITIENS